MPNLPDTMPGSGQIAQAQGPAPRPRRTRSRPASCDASAKPGRFCRPESPLLPRRPESFWKQIKRQRQGHRLGQDRQVDARSRGCGRQASRRPAPADPGTATTSVSCSGRLWAKAQIAGRSDAPTTPKIWVAMPWRDFLRRGGQAALGKGGDHDFLGPGIHQPHADHVAAKREKRHVAEATGCPHSPRSGPSPGRRGKGKASCPGS